jgi:hypothetical protein
MEKHKLKLERRTLKNYEAVLEDLRKQMSTTTTSSKTLLRADSSSNQNKLILGSNVMLKKLSVMKPPKEKPMSPGKEERSDGVTKIDGLFLSEEDMREEVPLMFEGQPINHFDDLLKHVKFDISEIMPNYKVTEEEFDPILDA